MAKTARIVNWRRSRYMESVTALSLAAINKHREVYDYLYLLTSEEIRQHCNEAVDFN